MARLDRAIQWPRICAAKRALWSPGWPAVAGHDSLGNRERL